MASYWPFGHLQTKLWAKEGPTTKSRESTSCRHPIWECNTSLEKSQRGLQLWFRPCRDPTLQSGVMSSQSPGTPPGTISGLQFRSPRKKSHLDVASAESRREYYKGEGGGFPRVRAVVSCDPKCPWLVPTPKGVPECELTTWAVCFDADSSLIY
jgi:hypothetical protein